MNNTVVPPSVPLAVETAGLVKSFGNYKALRTLRPGAAVKVDNSAPKREESAT